MRIMNESPEGITRGMDNVPMNAWYVVAGVEEIGADLLSRRVCDIPLVLYRKADGDPVALFDRCPHRWMPLSLGNRLGDEIQCRYHGAQFAASGQCTLIPSQERLPPGLGVRRFPLVDRPPFTWIWMGPEEAADRALIPDPGRVRSDYVQYFNFCYPIEADHLLMLENLMDTSHPTFLHPGSFDDGQLAGAPMRIETGPNLVRLIRDVGVHVPGEGTTRFFELDPGRPVRQTTITETFAPALNVIVYRFDYPDEPERPMKDFVVLAPITPSSPRSCYHFVASCFSWPVGFTREQVTIGTLEIIKDDKLALEAVEARRDEALPGEKEFHFRADTASLHLRRMIQEMARTERLQPVD
ncbi:aromatic ring-hydroxylating dioxygenase subunit alpha [Sphingobium sp.]|uniref:aromatic ring-hydroxylating dioxygenase subunit alpha n=1 Tax=Sphingobium sp. TaxID=1912891 RepID=UPI0028BE269E|nr:aromatic ring-hydroxylating dioxygenase subunit alpha [Sphingobium sp.]